MGEDVDWYRIIVPDGDNTLEVTLNSEPPNGVAYQLLDRGGGTVQLEDVAAPAGRKLVATVAPGEYLLRLEEPPRSVVFSWDTSGSMGAYQDIIYGSVSSFVRDVDPLREVVHLLPFSDSSGRFLLPDWSGDSLALMAAFTNYDRSDSSSDAEPNLLSATEALSERVGARAVIFMTDAESGGYASTVELWDALAEVRPRVFALETSSAGSAHTQDLMQSWASVAGGYYDYSRSVGDFEIAFARATCHMRRPARYSVSVETTNREPPGPGGISVSAAGGGNGGTDAVPPVEIILDASGSMFREFGGETRIDLAKLAVLELTSEVLPEGTPFALRVFGHREPNACRTDLELPLAPLDRGAVAALMPGIQPQVLAGTPIAESLLRAADDLGGRTSGAMIVVLTDGEESCGGDVEAAIRHLADRGIVARLSIVGFSDMEEDVKDQLRALAELGGGGFFEASDYGELATAMQEALTVPFEVLDAEGRLVVTGVVDGEAVEVPAGVYTVRVGTETFSEVRVPGERIVQLVLGADSGR